MKVVVNRRVGGFSLSDKAVIELYRLGSPFIKTTPYTSLYSFSKTIISKDCSWLSEENRFKTVEEYDLEKKRCSWICPRVGENVLDEQYRYEGRDDSLLIKVVEEMGVEANGEYADLVIVEIPDGIEFEIIENEEGTEYIAEKHRKWFPPELIE